MGTIEKFKYLEELEIFARQNAYPVILDDSKTELLKLVEKVKPKNILEIGTCIGYSGSLMLLSNESSNLTTIEINENSANMAKQTFDKLQLSDRVKLIIGDAKNVLLKLNTKFDFIFLDGPKGQYKNYLPILLNLLNVGGIIFADNVYFKGYVNMPETTFLSRGIRTIVRNLREYNKLVTTNPILSTTILDVGDGIAITTKIKEKE